MDGVLPDEDGSVLPQAQAAPAPAVISPLPPNIAKPKLGKPALGLKPTMRAFDDIGATRSAIFGGIAASASSIQPLVNKAHTLSVSDVGWDDPDEYKSIALQKKAILSGGTMSRNLKATLNLQDTATGDIIDSRRTTLARIPYLSNI